MMTIWIWHRVAASLEAADADELQVCDIRLARDKAAFMKGMELHQGLYILRRSPVGPLPDESQPHVWQLLAAAASCITSRPVSA